MEGEIKVFAQQWDTVSLEKNLKLQKSRYNIQFFFLVENDENMDIDVPKQEEPQHEQVEAYEDWKKRMLEVAYKELKELEKIEARKSVTPRKSPRKAPQKFSPYKSPTKTKGVRLLFPIDL